MFAFEDHTSEVQLRLEALTLAELFREAGLALAALMDGDGARSAGADAAPGAVIAEEVDLTSTDRDALLVDWLNELVFRAERARAVFGQLDVVEATDRTLRARIRGRPMAEPRTVVKAASMHGVRIAPAWGGLQATVILDV